MDSSNYDFLDSLRSSAARSVEALASPFRYLGVPTIAAAERVFI